MLPATLSPPQLLFFSILLCLLFSTSSLPPLRSSSHLSFLTQSSHLSLGLPRLFLPCLRNSAALFGIMLSAILSTRPAHCNLLLTSLSVKFLCTPVSSLNPPFFACPLSLRLLFFRPSCFRPLQALLLQFGQSQGFRSIQACWWDTSAHDLALQSFLDPPVRNHPLNFSPCIRSGQHSSTYLSPRLPVSAHCPSWVHETVPLGQFLSLQLGAWGQDYKRFSSMDWCSTHNLCSEMT